ncbi:substrate-binding domain-containing protein [Lactonifactor longoviformis]|uniref:Inositol transport system substrate-binding protein n=1 Tax=Lactonifactor longoviformis DSM 17459 TaxID=1122155 RepID=A0A1M5ABP0_9CLOT|nr:substrate-binding domain-containing protein [Lactonifactor longoviformis]SHF27585.1 inositol transport system substrate-binding protein [Lactonifactor longoviformis DSM 17459]
MRRKWMAKMLVLTMLAAGLAGCGDTAKESKEEEKTGTEEKASEESADDSGKEEITIGVTFQGLSDEYIVRLSDAFKKRAEEAGVNIQVADGQMNAEKQVGQVENFIAQKVDVIVMNPISADGCAPAVTAAKEAGIPIITLISTTSNQDQASTYVGSDAVESGEIQAEMVVEDLQGKGNIVVMFGQMGHDAQIGRYDGLKKTIEGTDIEIVAEQTANWSREDGMSLMENWLSSGKEIDAVVAQNDAMALGAVMAIEEKGMTGKIKVYGIDAQGEALDAVEKGTMSGTVFQNAEKQGSECVDVAIKAAGGETLENNYYIPYEGVRADSVDNYR